MKLVRQEPESDVLEGVLAGFERVLTSELAVVEVLRGGRRVGAEAGVETARRVLAQAQILTYARRVRDRAAALDPDTLGALDAIHLATALEVDPGIDAFVCYDRRLCEAAAAAGLTVLSPGVPTAPAG
jgi:predicted nucleic acid-binding protein